MRPLAHRRTAAALRCAASGALQALACSPGGCGGVTVGGSGTTVGGGTVMPLTAVAGAPVQLWGGLSSFSTQASPSVPAMLLAVAEMGSGGGGGGSDGSTSADNTCPAATNQLPEAGDVEQLLQLLGLSDAVSATELLCNLRKLARPRQAGVLQHAAAVMQHLCGPGVGLTRQQAGQLLEGCPELFSWEPEQRAALLFGELMTAGLAAGEAAQCFLTCPSAAKTCSLDPSELAAILAHSQDREGGSGPRAKVPAAERTVAALLQRSPSAVQLVCQAPGYLRQRSEQLQQAGFSAAQVAALAWFRHQMLCRDSAAKLRLATAVLGEELGLSPSEVVEIVVKGMPSWLSLSADTLRARATALAEGFGKAQAAAIVKYSPQALHCPPEVWQRNLRCMAACGVADPKTALSSHPLLLPVDHAAVDFVQRRLLLQRCFGVAAAQLYGEQSQCLTQISVQRLVQRLQFIEQRGQQHRLVARAPSGRMAAGQLPHERPLGMTAVVEAKQPAFLAAVGASEAEWAAFQQQHLPAQCALYRWAQQAAEQEVEQLRAALPAELRQLQRRRYMSR